jgi:hypothetical protein
VKPDPEYLAARRVLLDAVEALGPHREAVVLVGAQAIYLHVGESEMAVAPFTTDGDLAIDPAALGSEPDLSQSLVAAGFELVARPGTWWRDDVVIDLLVPASLGGPGRRGARLGAHGSAAARKARGLEAALVDRSRMRVAALDPADGRVFDVWVAGVAALLVAKLHKIADRSRQADRLRDKDGLDVLRLLRFADTAALAATLVVLATNPVAAAVTLEARAFLAALFAERDGTGSQMAVRASAGLENGIGVALSCEVLARGLLDAWKPKP